MLWAHVPPLFAQHHGDFTYMTQTQAGTKCPKRFAAFPPRLSRHPGALVVFLRHMGHKIFERFILHSLPSTGDRKDKGPAACRISFVPVLDQTYVGLGTIGSVPAHNHQLRPRRRDKCAYHLTEQGIFTAITGVALGQNEPKAHGEAIPVPCRHQQHEAQTKKPGMMLTYPAFLRDRILGASFV